MGTKCPSATFLPEAIFNYVLTVEEYVFALSEGKMPEKCERARKSARNYTNDFFFHSCVLIFRFSFMPCRERTCVKEQKHTLQKYRIRSNTNSSAEKKKSFFSFRPPVQSVQLWVGEGLEAPGECLARWQTDGVGCPLHPQSPCHPHEECLGHVLLLLPEDAQIRRQWG